MEIQITNFYNQIHHIFMPVNTYGHVCTYWCDDMPHSSIQNGNLSLLRALTNRPLSPEMKARGERARSRWGRGMRGGGKREESDFAALLADLVQSLWCSDWIPIQAFSLRGFGLKGVGRPQDYSVRGGTRDGSDGGERHWCRENERRRLGHCKKINKQYILTKIVKKFKKSNGQG